MLHIRLSILFIIAGLQFTYAQYSPEIDSLLAATSSMQADTNKVNNLNSLTKALTNKDNEKALLLGQEAIKLAEDLEFKAGLALAHKNTGSVYYRMSDYKKAYHYYNLSLEQYRETGDNKGEAILIRNIGSVYHQQGIYDEALKLFEESLAMRKQIGDKKGIASLYNAIGLVYYEQGAELYPNALKYFESALEAYQQLSDLRGIARAYLLIGTVKNAMASEKEKQATSTPADSVALNATVRQGREDALKYYTDCLVLADSIQDTYTQSQAYDAIGGIFNQFEEYKQSEENFLKSLSLNEEMGNQFGIANVYNNLGDIKYGQKQYQDAIQLYTKALNLSTEIQAPVLRKNSYTGLYSAWRALNNPKKALEFHELAVNLKDSIEGENLQETLAKQTQVLDFNEMIKEKELNVQKRELEHQAQLKQQKIYTWASGVAFLLMLGLAVVILINLQSKKKSNLLLSEKNDRIVIQNQVLQQKNEEIQQQQKALEKQHKEIMDSINYAQRIQQAVLPQRAQLQEVLNEHFVLFMPRDIVSGDFYWMKQIHNVVAFAAADCTGHGVPGAFMSMLGTSFLNELVTSRSLDNTGMILDKMRNKIKKSLNQTGISGEQKDGMDLSLMVLNMNTLKLQFSGAYNSVIIIRNNELIQLKADRQPIGIFVKEKPFTNQIFQLEKGDVMYAFSDGYPDQFGGEHGSKFKINQFRKLLLEINHNSMDVQKEILYKTFHEWRGDHHQIDDVLVCGVRL